MSIPPAHTPVAMIGALDTQMQYDGYTVRTYRDFNSGSGSWEICSDSHQLYGQQGDTFFVRPQDIESIVGKANTDVNGSANKSQNLVVVEWAGSASGSFDITVYDISSNARKLGTIRNSAGGTFVSSSNNGQCEFISRDSYWLHWNGFDSADSPLPRIVLQLRKGDYHFDLRAMKTADISDEEFSAMATASSGVFSGTIRTAPAKKFYSDVFDLTYHGHLNEALRLFDFAWMGSVSECQAEKRNFIAALARSPYWDDIQELQNFSG